MSLTSCRLPLLSLLAVAGFASTLAAQFEGTVTMHLSAARGANDLLYSVKNDRVRMDMTTPMGSVYIVRQGDKNSIVLPAQHMYMEQTTPVGMTVPGRAGADVKQADVNLTGRKETIAGYECEHAIITSDDGQYDVCLAKGLGTFMAPSNPMGGRGGDDSPASSALKKLGGDAFPLKVQKVGGEVALEVTKIEKKSLDDTMFTVPSDYRKLDIGGLLGRPPGTN